MVILLQGPDEYRRRVKREAVVSEFLKKHGSSGLGRFDAEEGEADLESFLKNQSMFAPVRLAVVEHPFDSASKTLPDLIASFLADPHTTVLLSSSEKPPKAWNFLASKTKKGPAVLAQTFDHLAGAEWTAFIRAEAKARGVSLAPGALKLLAAAFHKDPWRLVTELAKLSLLKREVTEVDLAESEIEAAPDFWAMLSGFRSPRLGDRLLALERVFARNEPAAKLFHVLAYQLREKLPRFALYDLAVKSGKLEYEEALVDSVL